MQSISDQIKQLFTSFNNVTIQSIEKLPQSGSDRIYFRITASHQTYIATYNSNVKENQTFIAFSHHFKQQGCPVPEVYAVNENATIYIQEDLDNSSLLNELEQHGHTDAIYSLFKKSLQQLAHLQIKGEEGIDYELCLTAKEFGKQAILSDLLYFKYYFLDTLKYPYDKQALLEDFEALSNYLTHTANKHFMFRDFQARNIMVKNREVYFIDYQGGMKGALQYDVASLLWQAKAELPDNWKTSLLDYYLDCVDKILKEPVDRTVFISQYNGYVLVRLLQVLGAYGFRGLFERKAHFLTSIPLALQNLKWFLENKPLSIYIPEFLKVLKYCVSKEVIEKFTPIQANEHKPLTVYINSFSYIQNGYPKDESKNGGGFVFDCRGLLNPGRIEKYKILSGKDKEVIDYLEQNTRMSEFLNSVYNLVDISVEDYIKRDFERLMINFGCTGGQHRSVYAAEQTARHLCNKYKVKTVVNHTNAENWKKQ